MVVSRQMSEDRLETAGKVSRCSQPAAKPSKGAAARLYMLKKLTSWPNHASTLHTPNDLRDLQGTEPTPAPLLLRLRPALFVVSTFLSELFAVAGASASCRCAEVDADPVAK